VVKCLLLFFASFTRDVLLSFATFATFAVKELVRMTLPVEEPTRFRADGRDLAGILHHPASGSARAAVLVVPPFAEEEKFSHRVFVNCAREFARRDVATLRFDLSGCGDSSGDSGDSTLALWRRDILAARALLVERFPRVPLVLMGLRLGATLALDAAAEPPSPAALVLWEPVTSGGKYIDEILRRRMIKEMMTTGRKATGRDASLRELAASGVLDLDGLAVSRALIEEISALDAATLAPRFSGRVLCVQISYNARVSSALESLAQTFAAAHADVRTLGVREQTIWDRVELVEARELIDTTASWLADVVSIPSPIACPDVIIGRGEGQGEG
jgi:exosortase A-associated hydrolase 2